jgi:hypothetical protein
VIAEVVVEEDVALVVDVPILLLVTSGPSTTAGSKGFVVEEEDEDI